MKLNTWTGVEGLPVVSLHFDRPLHSEIRADMAAELWSHVVPVSCRMYKPSSQTQLTAVLDTINKQYKTLSAHRKPVCGLSHQSLCPQSPRIERKKEKNYNTTKY